MTSSTTDLAALDGDGEQEPRSRVSRRSLLQLALAGSGAVATGPVLSRLGVLGGTRGVLQQAALPGVISGTAPMKGPAVPKFQRELLRLEDRAGALGLRTDLAGQDPSGRAVPYRTETEQFDGVDHQVDYFAIEQRTAMQDLLPAPFPQTQIWAYNGIYPGPIFRRPQNGNYTVVENTNSLPLGHGTSTHLHGSPTQPAHDGHPDDETWAHGTNPEPLSRFYDDGVTYAYCPQHVYRYPNGEDTRTLWYHDHGMHQTAEQVYKGLVGMFIQEPDAASVAKLPGLAQLPAGKYDQPMIVGDMQFDVNGNVAYDDKGHDSLWGNVLLVNGRAWPKMTVDATRYRFRFLVADLSRGYSFELATPSLGSAKPTMTMIGTDAGLLARTAVISGWRQGMAERYEVVIDFSGLKAGETVTLLNSAASGDMGQVLQFVCNGTKVPSNPVPAALNDYVFGQEEVEVVNKSTPRYFRFERSGGLWVINGLPWTGAIAAKPKVGTVELWTLENKSGGWFHPVHIHLVDFHVVRRNGKTPPAWEQGWKDVVYVGPNEKVDLVMRFNAARQMDNDTVPVELRKKVTGKYVMHCHNLVHEDHDMMTQFQTQPDPAAVATKSAVVAAAMPDMPGMQMGAGTDAPSMMVQWQLDA